MTYRNALTGLSLTAAFCLTGTALAGECAADSSAYSSARPIASSAPDRQQADIVDTAIAAGSFDTLVAALKAADLVEALRGDGPFTVFAPTDAAFAKLPDGTLQSLLKPENKDALKSILLYHVAPGRLMAKNVTASTGEKSLNGQFIDFKTKGRAVMIDNAKVAKADIRTSNGVIHVIDTVILPNSDSIVSTASSAGNFNTLLAACQAAGLAELLDTEGPFTVFAPTDEAFAKLPAGTVETLLKPENRDQLKAILTYHVVPGRLFAANALKAGKAETAQGSMVRIQARNGQPMVNNANIVATNIDASNGVIHVIDTVIMPPSR